MSYGQLGHLGICFQESFDTAYTSSMHYFPILSETLDEKKPPIMAEGMRGRFEEGGSFEGFNEIAGDIVFEAHPILVGKMLRAWCGQSSGELVASHYTHGIKPRTVDFDDYAAVPPMTIEVNRDVGSAAQYYNMCCDGFVIEVAHNAVVKCTMSLVGGAFSKIAKSSPSYLTGSEFTFDQTSISIAGNGIDDVVALTITGANNLEGKGTLDGTKVPNRIKRTGFRTLEIAGTIVPQDDTELDIYRAQTEQRLVVTVTGQEVSSGYNAELTVDIPSMRYVEHPRNIGGPGMLETQFTASAKYNAGSGCMAEFTCVNTVVRY